jgi:hypothetical protein
MSKSKTDNEQINKKIDSLLKNNIEFKYKKFHNKPIDELKDEIINLEVTNCNLEKNVSKYKYQFEILKQKNLDLQIELNEINLKLKKANCNCIKHEIKIIEPKPMPKPNDYSSDESPLNTKTNSLLNSIKKNKTNENIISGNLTNLINELKITKDQLKEKENIITEKDNIITILYQEIDNMKSNRQSSKDNEINNTNSLMYSPDFKRIRRSDHFSFNKLKYNSVEEEIEGIKKSYLDNLDIIKLSLVEFLEQYNIKDNISFEENSKEIDSTIEARVKEIKYIMVNMKKINILFKTLFKEFAKDLYQTVDIILNNQVNQKIEVLNKRVTKMAKSAKKGTYYRLI